MLLGGVDAPPAGHAEDVDQARQGIDPVPPAAVEPHALGGIPPAAAHDGSAAGCHRLCALDGGLHIGEVGDQDVDGHDDEGEGLEPLVLAQAFLVLEHHKADAAGAGGVQLCVVEPAVHVLVGLVVQRPGLAHSRAHGDGDEIGRQSPQHHTEDCNAALLGLPCDLVGDDQAREYQNPPQDLPHAFNLE